MKTNIILVADPKIGKSTVLLNFLSRYYTGSKSGILTTEIKKNDQRLGFEMEYFTHSDSTLIGGIIASIYLESQISVSKYKVDVQEIEWICLHCLQDVLKSEFLSYIDEIGEMQLHSTSFRKLVKARLDLPNICIATLSNVYHDDFTNAIRKRDDCVFIEVTKDNRDTLPQSIHELYWKMKRGISFEV